MLMGMIWMMMHLRLLLLRSSFFFFLGRSVGSIEMRGERDGEENDLYQWMYYISLSLASRLSLALAEMLLLVEDDTWILPSDCG